jgi:hypothetical protein
VLKTQKSNKLLLVGSMSTSFAAEIQFSPPSATTFTNEGGAHHQMSNMASAPVFVKPPFKEGR